MAELTAAHVRRLQTERNIWMATSRPSGRPHLVPVWFVWLNDSFYVAVQPDSVKARNLRHNQLLSLALEDGSNVLICEGAATPIERPYPQLVREAFDDKYDWQLASEQDYTLLLRITPRKWLTWG